MRVSPRVKSDTERIFSCLDMTLTEAINIFLHKSVMESGPFDVCQPRYNKETETAMREARDIISGKKTSRHLRIRRDPLLRSR